MTNRFVRSSATGAANGTSWTDAYTNLTAAIAASSAGDTFFVADDHAETTTSTTVYTFKGTATAPDVVVCVDHTIASPGSGDLKTTATVSVTGTAAGLQVRGHFYCYGISWILGTSTSAQQLQVASGTIYVQIYQNCSFVLGGTGTQTISVNNGVDGKVRWINCSVSFGATSQQIIPGQGLFEWVGTPTGALLGSVPTTLFAPQTGTTFIEGVDLSPVASGSNLVQSNVQNGLIIFKDCKLGASVNVSSSPSQESFQIVILRSDNGNTNYRNELYSFNGSQVTETTIVRTGGATDGTTAFSQKVVTGTSAKWSNPFELLPLTIWNDTVGSAIGITVEGIASAVPNNDEVWMAVAYLGSSTSPLGSRASTNKVALATAAANTSSSSTWGGALTGKFKMAVSITPQQKGPITVYVKIGKPSATIYIDPLITVS
jgi:hypothetical protein